MTVLVEAPGGENGFFAHAASRVAVRGCRLLYEWKAPRDTVARLRAWRVEGLEFRTPEAARSGDFGHNAFRIHHFQNWDAGDDWLHERAEGHDDADVACGAGREAHQITGGAHWVGG